MHAAILSTAETGEQRERCLGVENVPFSVHKAYQRIRGKQGMEDETTMRACQAKSPIRDEDFRMASPEEKAGDSSILEKNVPRCIGRMCFVLGRKKRLQTSILLMPLCTDNIGLPEYNSCRGYLRDEFLGLNKTRRSQKEGGWRANTCGNMGHMATLE